MTYGQLERRNGEQHVGREPRVDLASEHITLAVSELETHDTHPTLQPWVAHLPKTAEDTSKPDPILPCAL